jgi:hypothetical protein
MEFEVKRWLNLLVTEPDNFGFSLEDLASKIMCTLTWDDHAISAYCTKSAWGLLTQMSPAGPITNVLTPLWHLPDIVNPWRVAERKRHDEQQAWWMERLLTTRRLMEKGKQRPCFTRTFLETAEKTSLSGDYEASSVIGMMALVGIFTVAGPLNYFFGLHDPSSRVAGPMSGGDRQGVRRTNANTCGYGATACPPCVYQGDDAMEAKCAHR